MVAAMDDDGEELQPRPCTSLPKSGSGGQTASWWWWWWVLLPLSPPDHGLHSTKSEATGNRPLRKIRLHTVKPWDIARTDPNESSNVSSSSSRVLLLDEFDATLGVIVVVVVGILKRRAKSGSMPPPPPPTGLEVSKVAETAASYSGQTTLSRVVVPQWCWRNVRTRSVNGDNHRGDRDTREVVVAMGSPMQGHVINSARTNSMRVDATGTVIGGGTDRSLTFVVWLQFARCLTIDE
jgi:hypothetical protein